ncbi:ASCH domain-containing protein [Ornithinimicrobium avium]|nr:ASCH domain-containing protein [Ornithinimicrobium avium]
MDDALISAFWADARLRGGINPVAGYLGATAADTLPPPAWSFGAAPLEADRLLAQVLAGRKTATTSALWDYEEEARARAEAEREEPGGEADGGELDLGEVDHGEVDHGEVDHGGDGARGHGGDTLTRTRLDLALPAPGSLSIVVDGQDVPRALIRTTHVELVPYGEVDEAHALREGFGSLAQWRAEHRRFFSEHAPADHELTDGTMLVLERFVVLVPARARRAARRAGLL